jgi:hypothetical protein
MVFENCELKKVCPETENMKGIIRGSCLDRLNPNLVGVQAALELGCRSLAGNDLIACNSMKSAEA